MTQKFESFKTLLDDVSEFTGSNGLAFMHDEVSSYDDLVELSKSEEFAELPEDIKEKVKLFTLIMHGAECVEEFGGEGLGDSFYAIWHFPYLNLYVQFDGWYASSQGSEYEECFEVEPKEVTIIQYNRV